MRKQETRIRKAAVAVEFAVVAPLFLLLLGGIIEFGQAFHIQHMLSTSSRRGARAAIITGSTSTQVRDKVELQCVNALNLDAADVTVGILVNGSSGIDLSDADEGDEISLTVSVPFSKAGVGFFAKLFSARNLSSTCTLEHE